MNDADRHFGFYEMLKQDPNFMRQMEEMRKKWFLQQLMEQHQRRQGISRTPDQNMFDFKDQYFNDPETPGVWPIGGPFRGRT